MSYDCVREGVPDGKGENGKRDKETQRLMEAIERLSAVMESELAEIKRSLGHLARLIESRREH